MGKEATLLDRSGKPSCVPSVLLGCFF